MTRREGKGAAAYRLGILWAVLFLCWVAGGRVDAAETPSPCLRSFFTKSLHFTGEGMRYWYEEAGGFMRITGIPYRDLDCKIAMWKAAINATPRKLAKNSPFPNPRPRT